MNRRGNHHKPKQPDLFGATIGHNGAPSRSREGRQLYTGVLFLRIYGGKTVYRVGREHLVAGRQVSTGQLQQLVKAECGRPCNRDELPDYVLHRLGMA